MFTRSLEEITDRVPEVVEAVAPLPAPTLVLDGEAIALDEDGRAAAVPGDRRRTRAARRRHAASRCRSRRTSSTCCYVDGEDLVDVPRRGWLRRLSQVLPAELVVPRTVTADPDEAKRLFAEVVAAGHEGVVVKGLDAPYDAGRRGAAWVKVKPGTPSTSWCSPSSGAAAAGAAGSPTSTSAPATPRPATS